ncbi:alcohol dehydrogenase, propanol-preferring [Verrucomicrobium sp. GAS474]|uniref:zinc-dependent alcohol dehydrogenase family protein n=1 Tax=Verrucomicrobium sp. GAS474 TaxID=1882831 RepID=UPI00087BFEC6|nr:alcohol dehydrogenase, propanol-preferring [Verrucomicrobium sp. GAS474]
MRAMVLESPRTPLREMRLPRPTPGTGQVLVRVSACAVCRTDLQIADGELTHSKLPLVLGHEVVGQVVETGSGAERFKIGTRVGIPWLGWSCGECRYCRSEQENLCEMAQFTGYTLDGGYAEYMTADERFCFAIPESYSDIHAAPLLCAGLIGYRCLCKSGKAERLGIYGFGAAGHIVSQIAQQQGRQVYAFTRPGDDEAQQFALSLGAIWSGDSKTRPPKLLDAAIIFASSGELVPQALKAVAPGGIVVCGGIHMSDIPSFSYDILWRERSICSVANLTRRDGEEFMALASRLPLKTSVQAFSLSEANEALTHLRTGKLQGAAVLMVS